MHLIDFTQTGGYRFKQPTLAKMQASYYETLKAFITYLQVSDSGSYIISGCEISGANITPGIMYIDGELCSFAGSAGTLTTKIAKNVTTSVLAFKNGSNLPVFRATAATVNPAGVELQSFTRVTKVQELLWSNISGIPTNLVYDASYVHTDNNFTNLLLAKLNGIESGAEVNVQGDWLVTNPASDAFIKNKPTIVETLKVGTVYIGSVYSWSGTSPYQTVTFPTALSTSDYVIFGQIRTSNGVQCDVNIISQTTTYFRIKVTVNSSEGAGTALGVYYDYYILPRT